MRPLHTIPLAVVLLGLTAVALPAREVLVHNPDELKTLLKTVQPGDTLLLADGTWTDADIVFDADGTADRPITLRAQHPGQFFLTGQSSIRIGGRHLVIDGLCFKEGHAQDRHAVSFRTNDRRRARHCRLTNTAFLDYNPPSRTDSSYWVSLYGISNRVDHCLFQGKNDGSPTVTVWVEDEPNHHRIDHNRFIGRPPLGRNGGETLRVGDSKMSQHNSRTLVEFNYFEDCSGESEFISNKSCENVYRHNTFVECQGALVLRHGNRCQVEANWFLGRDKPGTGGVRIIGEDHRIVNNYFDSLAGTDFESALPLVNGIPNSKLNEYFRVKRATVAFNTFVNCRQNITFGVGVGRRNRVEPPEDCLFANNLIVSSHQPLVRVEDEPVRTRWVANLAHGTALGVPESDGLRPLDPRLEQGADGLWRPSGQSPARGAAQGDFADVAEDIEGRARGLRKDLGCVQWGQEPARHAPLGRPDTGPGWH
jgi:poly(beta-D-mannuronate) lyase